VEPILIFIVAQQIKNAAFYSLHFHDGDGGVTFTPLLEYRPATSRWGVMLQARL
jgi:hypothetical protein